MKLCKRCNTTKPENEFHPSTKQGKQFWCKVCMIESNKIYQKNRLAKQRKIRLAKKQALIDAKVKRCPKCEQTLPINNFNKGQHYCKACKSISDKKSRNKLVMESDKNQFPHTYTKICGRCGINKSMDAFYPSASAADGKQSYCKICSREFDKQAQEMKKIERALAKKAYSTQSQFNNTGYFDTIRGGKENAGRPNADLLELTPERIEFLNLQRIEWRKVFDERHNDIMVLIKAYEAEPDNSVNLISEFHDNIRPNWKLQHKTPKQLKNEYIKFLRDKYNSSVIG